MDEDKKKTKKWKKKKGEVDGGHDLRLHRVETAHVSSTYCVHCFIRVSYRARADATNLYLCLYYKHTVSDLLWL